MSESFEERHELSADQLSLSQLIIERTKRHADELSNFVIENTGDYLDPTMVVFKLDTFKFSILIGECDELALHYQRYDPKHGWGMMGITLFRDRSPFMIDQDYDDYGPEDNEYLIVSVEDRPPFIVHNKRINVDDGIDSIYDYLDSVGDSLQPKPYLLSDNDCRQITEIVTNKELPKYIDTDEGIDAATRPNGN